MANYKDQVISGRVVLDAGVFDTCDFEQVQMIYSGGPPPQFNNCRLNDATVTFDGAANSTLLFLRSMAAPASGMRAVVDGLIPELTT